MNSLNVKLVLVLIAMGIIVLFMSLLYGCKIASYSYHDSSGKIVHKITCIGADDNWKGFEQEASDICGTSGYTIISEEDIELSDSRLIRRTFCITCNDE